MERGLCFAVHAPLVFVLDEFSGISGDDYAQESIVRVSSFGNKGHANALSLYYGLVEHFCDI